MTVSLICNHNVATIAPTEGIAAAAARMREEHVGTLIVAERRGSAMVPVGILTDRDIVVGVVAKGVPADAVTVGDAMTRDLLSVREDDGVEFALREMRRKGVRRAPVVGKRGALVGIVSLDDVVQHLATQLGRLADAIRLEQDAETKARP
ncbi:MAG TPA: CBS domain-containing protein [Gammaproteobacteria bacterium]|jgi:CBS domain-containing protein|nr:CBS domain-containing protein [Gammaproteobacteria bacterium]